MIEYLTKEQLDRLRTLAKAPRDWLLIEVQYETGCTVSELIDIKAHHVHDGLIIVGGRRAVVSKRLTDAAKEHLASHESPYLFPTRQTPQMTDKRVQQIIKGYLKRLRLPQQKKTPHLLRYTHIAHALQQRIPLPAIMHQTGLGELRLSQIAMEVAPQDHDAYGRMFA